MSSIDLSTGKTMIVEFIRGGIAHRSIRWCSDPTMMGDLMEKGEVDEIKRRYAAVDAEVVKISRVETNEVCCG